LPEEFLYTLERVLPNARKLTSRPLLVRLDSGHDAWDTRIELAQQKADSILKWNPRRQDPHAWLEKAEELGQWETPREGKRIATFSVEEEKTVDGEAFRFRRVMRVIERTIDKHSQTLLILDIERLPSGKFDTNDLIMTLAALGYNILRWIGLISLAGDIQPGAPLCQAAPS